MFDNEDDNTFYKNELLRLQEKSANRAAAFRSLVDGFFESLGNQDKDAKKSALKKERESLEAQFLGKAAPERNPGNLNKKANIARSGFGYFAGTQPSTGSEALGPGPTAEAPSQASPTGQGAVTKKFGVASRLGRFR
jgi:hypothetical protein